MRRIRLPLMALALLLTLSPAAADEAVDVDAVESAVRQYVHAKYAGDVDGVQGRAHHDIMRAVRMDIYWGQPSDDWVRRYTHDHLQYYGTDANDVRRDDPTSGRCEIEVFDLEQRSAAARVVMEDVVDFLHLVRFDGRWMIADSAVLILEETGDDPPAVDMSERDAVASVVRDYAMGFYEIDGDKVQGTCHPTLSKRAVERRDGFDFDTFTLINWDEIRLLGHAFNSYWDFDPDEARVGIDVYEIRDGVAAAKLTGTVWMDYFHLMKVNGDWQIVNIVFESLPRDRWANVPQRADQG